jgi:ribosomal protein L37AE/L43A
LSPAAAGAGSALGITAKSSAAFIEVICEKTGEIQRFRRDSRRDEYVLEVDAENARNEARAARFALQASARSIMRGKLNPRGKEWRVRDCLRAVTGGEVAVLYSPKVERAHFSGLATCGSVWACPVCSAKVSERRKAEIVEASDLHKTAGGGLYMVTLTWAHTRNDDVGQMVKRSREALTRLRKQRAYVKLNKFIEYVGMVRAFEVTHGDANGWHPHFHELWFLKEKLTSRQLEMWRRVLFEEWRAQCKRSGLGIPNRKAGITIIEAESAAEYVAKFGNMPKWGIGSELTKRHSKKGRSGSRTPWDLLRLYAEGESRFAPLFEAYANAFFGARQVFWSPGLKQAFGINELTDEELAAQQEQDARELCRITKAEWKLVLSIEYDQRALILRMAEYGGSDAVRGFLYGLRPS